MRKVTAGLFSSIDGVVEAPNEWQPAFDEEMGAVLSRMLEEQDAVLLGRVTFTEWAGYWPTSTDEPFASYINSTQKYVASTTLGTVDQWPNSTLIKGRTVPLGYATVVSRASAAGPRRAVAWSGPARLEPGCDAVEHAVQAELEALVPGFRRVRVDVLVHQALDPRVTA